MPRYTCKNCYTITSAPDWRRPPMHHQAKPVTIPICPVCHEEIAA